MPFVPTTLVTAFRGMPAQAAGGGPGGASATEALGADSFDAEPMPSVAVTRTRNESPTFLAESGSVLAVAPARSVQPLPSPKQRCHWYANAVGAPVHAPSPAVSVRPACATPS